LNLLFLVLCLSFGVLAQTPTPSPTPTVKPDSSKVNTTKVVPAADLPNEPPPVAPNFTPPVRPLPSAERVGVDAANQIPLTLDQAIEMALQNNNDIDSSRISVKIAEENLKGAKGAYDPQFSSESFYESRTTPTASTIGGAGSNGAVTQTSFGATAAVDGLSPKAGGTYSASASSSQSTTNNQNATLNPQYPSAITLSYTQPLWRGLRTDNNRRQVEIAKKNLSLTDAQFRQQVIENINRVEQAYWDLVFALRNLQVQIDAVKQARTQLESNQRLVDKGVLAPIEIVSATAQITTFEQNVYSAQETVTQAENTLKTLILKDRTADLWSRPLTPVTPVELEAPRVPLDTAIADALKNRPEIQQLQTNQEINKINVDYFRDQTKPQIDLFGTYTSNGLAGTANNITRTSTTVNSDLLARINELSTLGGLTPLVIPPTVTVTSPPTNLTGGFFNSLGNLFAQDYPTYRFGVRINLPFGNRVAEADLGRTLAEGSQIRNQRSKTEQTIEAEVRNALQSLRSAEARLASATASRSASEQLFESEQRQFRAGTTTVYLVQQRQNDLLVARSRELQAQTDLNKAIANFQRATGTTLTVNNININLK
jgi:HAE1 family hydrophobic/amphiphilic exporter-1